MEREVPVILDRVAFDAYFGEQAQKLGAVYQLGEKYQTHWALKDGRVRVKTDHFLIDANVIVGADGVFSKVAARIGVKNRWIPATQARVSMKVDVQQAAMYFDPDWKELFGYIVPEGKNGICRIGLAAQTKPNVAFAKFLKLIRISENTIINRQGGAIPFGFPRRIVFRNTLLLGDSASMVKATTGGGIVMITAAVKVLADAISKAAKRNDFSERFFQRSYEGPIKRHIGLELKIHYFLRLVIMHLTKFDFNLFFNLYQTTNFHKVVEQYGDMDYPLRMIQQLLRNRAFLLFIGHIILKNWMLLPQFIHDIAL